MQRGFTLVELAVVLTIIGLIIGGVIVGSDMIKSARLNSLWTDKQKYVSAVNAFRDKYQYLPGDMPNATAFWGSLGGTGSDTTCDTTTSSGIATCNGDGNGQVDAPNSAGVHEHLRFWQQLSNAGLIEGNYCGANATQCGQSTGIAIGVNVPPSKFPNAYWYAAWIGVSAGSTTGFAGNYGNLMRVAGNSNFQPIDAYQFDSKFDDGLPGSGAIISYKGDGISSFCTTAAGVAPPGDVGATYKISNINPDCYFNFVRAF